VRWRVTAFIAVALAVGAAERFLRVSAFYGFIIACVAYLVLVLPKVNR
jgi:hypothetical protein